MLRWLTGLTCLTVLGVNLQAFKADARVKCNDFTYREDAQTYMRQHGATYLDGDRNGVACESLPQRSSAPTSRVNQSKPDSALSTSLTGQVVSVGDGDTFRLRIQGTLRTVRLSCVDSV